MATAKLWTVGNPKTAKGEMTPEELIDAGFAQEMSPSDETRPTECEGCKRAIRYPRHTLRFWQYDDDCGPEGCYAHVDPSGSVYPCRNQDGTAPAILNDHE